MAKRLVKGVNPYPGLCAPCGPSAALPAACVSAPRAMKNSLYTLCLVRSQKEGTGTGERRRAAAGATGAGPYSLNNGNNLKKARPHAASQPLQPRKENRKCT